MAAHHFTYTTHEASSSKSRLSLQPHYYDVFLSFVGKDTRMNFVDHLLAALERNGLYTFCADKNIRRGAKIRDETMKAIQNSRAAIVVFSKNYATSTWCLDELVQIMECRAIKQQTVLPIFYDVKPSDVRGQNGCYGESFAAHEERYKGGQLYSKVEAWRAALTQAGSLACYDLRNLADGHESKFIDKIVDDVSNKFCPTQLSVADYPVGLERRTMHMYKLLDLETEDVRFLVICGIGGIGKTTLAKEIYNRLHRKFEGNGFLENVRETSRQPDGLVLLQRKLLSSILKRDAHKYIENDHHGIKVLEKRLWYRRVLVVLDDVDNTKQLKALAINRERFFAGSRIIITTRDMSALNSLQLKEDNELYNVPELDLKESLELFSWHAFNEIHPLTEYKDLSHKVIGYARGIPLVLEILGSFLSDKNATEWRSELKKLDKIPHSEVHGSLRISFDSLDTEQKSLFLYIACFFLGEELDFAVKVLEGFDLYPDCDIKVLARRCLVKVRDNCLIMHDLIRDMGREIVRQESIKDPGKRSRIWDHDDAFSILKNNTGTEAITGLVLSVPMSNEMVVDAKVFERMNQMKLLHLKNVRASGSHENFSKRLVWLSWHRFPLKCVPSNFLLDNVIALDLQHSNLKKVWKGSQILPKLKFFDLSYSDQLVKTPKFYGLTSLEALSFYRCSKLEKVHKSVWCLKRLRIFNLEFCENLKRVPETIFTLTSLQILCLNNCSKLENVFGFETSPSSSTSWQKGLLCQRRSSVNTLTISSPRSMQLLCSLRELKLVGCNLSHVPDAIGNLVTLDSLQLSSNQFHSLPNTMSNLHGLNTLYLLHCPKLRSLPALPSNLIYLYTNGCISLEEVTPGSQLNALQCASFYGCLKKFESYFSLIFGDRLMRYPETSRFIDVIASIKRGFEIPRLDDYVMGSLIYLKPPLMVQNRRFIKGWLLYFLLPECYEPSAVTHRAHNTTKGCEIAYEENVSTRCRAGAKEYVWIHFLPTYQLDPPNQFPLELFDEIWYSFDLVPPCPDMDINKPLILKRSAFITYIYESHEKNNAELRA